MHARWGAALGALLLVATLGFGLAATTPIPYIMNWVQVGGSPINGTYFSGSQTVPTTATQIWPASAAGTPYVHIRYVDTTIQSGAASAVTIWCARGTVGSNRATVGGVGMIPLNAGYDDNGPGVDQQGLNCIQAAGGTHTMLAETW